MISGDFDFDRWPLKRGWPLNTWPLNTGLIVSIYLSSAKTLFILSNNPARLLIRCWLNTNLVYFDILAERHDTRKYVNKVVTSEDSLLCAKGQVYLIYPLPWLLRVGNIYKHVGLKFFSVSWHSKQEKSIWFEILFFNKNRLDYGVPYLATLAVRSLIRGSQWG